MISKRHLFFNMIIVIFPWLTLLFIGKSNFKRYSVAGVFIIVFEIFNHLYGNKKKWWKFYDKKDSFLKDELPFSIGPYAPFSMWLLKYSYGSFKKFLLLNVLADGIFAFIMMDIMKKFKIIRLNRLSRIQFFFYIHYKAYLLYGVQYLYEKWRSRGRRIESLV
ncbi:MULTISPECIES: hypothetical protein [Sutcliffiella]|uniref:Uncharacterized protein n=1 Tax=Sutcliffiella cohnii TaxID=33932 RepID=A0A223KPL3_9BACI|nr:MULTISPECIES: hypothetical protein [Sutcliffiella]AST91294.1 hypothetical protein BC6307_08385 [Sutcliffiella cohnii]MED4018912.1 hypothetical protein [Sutcliffiella cohnii]WBL17118.1 hypothetical protein O1A01_10995 [Sutcliffiella sp. NC1]